MAIPIEDSHCRVEVLCVYVRGFSGQKPFAMANVQVTD